MTYDPLLSLVYTIQYKSYLLSASYINLVKNISSHEIPDLGQVLPVGERMELVSQGQRVGGNLENGLFRSRDAQNFLKSILILLGW